MSPATLQVRCADGELLALELRSQRGYTFIIGIQHQTVLRGAEPVLRTGSMHVDINRGGSPGGWAKWVVRLETGE